MDKKRNVILFGAGAVIDCGGPKTEDLTNILLVNGFFATDNKTRITKYIYDKLIGSGFEKSDINFETIINVIEELIVYYSRFTTETDVRSYEIGKAPPSILSAFFIPRFEKDIMNFSVNWRPPTTVFTLDIPGKNPEYAKHGYKQSKTPEQFFLEQLLSELLTAIVTEINKYAYHTEITSNVFKTDVRKNFASRFSNWVNSFSSTDIVRMYSLNYDRNFKIYLEANNTSIFEGFNCHDVQCGAILKPGDIGVPDIKRILTDFDCISYYNIHGSAFWDVIPRDKSHFFNPKFVLHGYPRFPSSNYELANTQIETGKTMFVSNIITGYQKSQRTVITPFRQMQAAFDKDCLFADTIYIIGYSFGDEHINVSIKNALECNPNTQIIIVDKGFIQNQMDLKMVEQFFSSSKEEITPRKDSQIDNHYFYLNDSVEVHNISFSEFLDKVCVTGRIR